MYVVIEASSKVVKKIRKPLVVVDNQQDMMKQSYKYNECLGRNLVGARKTDKCVLADNNLRIKGVSIL